MSDPVRQFLHEKAQLIIKELVKAAILKVIEHIMEERLIYDEYTGQPTRVHMVRLLNDGCVVAVEGRPQKHLGGGIYSHYNREIPKQIWDKLSPADPTRTQLVDRVKSALQPLGLEVTTVDDHNPYNCVIITANGFFSRGEDDETKFDTESNFGERPVRDNPEAFLPRFNQRDAKAIHDRVLSKVPIDSRGLHLPDAQSIRDGAIGKVGDTEMRVGGLPYPRIGVIPSFFPSINPFKPTAEVKGRDFTENCFCCGDNDGHALGSPGACVSRTHGIEIGDTVQSVDNDDGVVIEINGPERKVKWNLTGKESWLDINNIKVLARGNDIVIRDDNTRLFATFKDAAEIHGWKVPGESTSASSCSCANPACTWRGSFECKYDTFSHLENRGAIE